ncbi:MAG: class I SAM-dependent methyltransferase [Eubacteriales bacterium]|nr:class I SAM-dependent methyltransferase [Eubacteriales bacterium]
MSGCYETFASVYDSFMDNIPYEEWSIYLKQLLQQENIENGTLVELGCGTGSMMQQLASSSYQILGVDISTDMLSIAADKLSDYDNTTLLLQDMRILDLGMQANAIYSVCDSMNYILTDEDLLDTFQGAHKHLHANGVFIFDLKTDYFYREILGDQIFCDHQEHCSYTWENSFFEEDCINQYDLTLFVKEPDSHLYRRFQETHHQRAYELSTIMDLLKQAGFHSITAYDAFTTQAPHAKSERIYLIARNGE